MLRNTALILLLTISFSCFAGGPLILEGPAGITPVTYQNPNITVHIENGDLGQLDNAAADALVFAAFELWNNVDTSTIKLNIDQSQIDLDINLTNFEDYIPTVPGTGIPVFNDDDGLNPIIYDNNGEIIDAYFGAGQSDHTIGFAASIILIGSNYFTEGYAVINGKDLGLTDTKFKLLIAHEIAHFFGLDHTQVDINNQETDFGTPRLCSTGDQSTYPLMYPFVCRDEETLHMDDVSAVSALYPSADMNNSFGILQGQFVDETNRAILGANIWAMNTITGETVSIISDYLTQGTGFYKLYLPAGSYTLHANSINTLFNGGSGIGPYSYDILDISFQDPHPIIELTFQGDSTGSDEIITISNNQTQVINFAIDGKTAVITAGDDDEDGLSEMFGATSHITVLMMLGLLITGRIKYKNCVR